MSTVTQSNLASSVQESVQELKDEVVRELWKKGGRACVADLANEMNPPKSAKELNPIVKSLAEEGIIRPAEPDPKDPRQYKTPDQTIYEFAR
jgi:polyhydroxyalkanoate synthesis regulator phasin